MTGVVRGRGSEKLEICKSDMYHVPYKRSFGPEQLKELYNHFEFNHLEFLRSEGDRKVEYLRLLKGYAVEFLSQVSHSHKFKFAATEGVLSQSIALVSGFDPREASMAYEDLAKYAHNLLEQPWRKEFHRLKITSGFFIHNIRARLKNPQEILILLGYVGTDDYTMELALSPDPVILAAVSRDCYLASQECQILSQIFDRVLTELKQCSLTIQEVYTARKLLMGDTTTIVNHLVDQNRLKLSRFQQTSDSRYQQQFHSESQSRLESQVGRQGFPPADHLVDVVDGRNGVGHENRDSIGLCSTSKTNGLKSNKVLSSISSANHIKSHPSEISSDSRHNSNSTSRSSSVPRSPNSCNSLKELKELHEVFYQTQLQSKGKEEPSDSGSDISEMLDKHHHYVSQVDAMKQQRKSSSQLSQPKQMRGRKSEFGTQSTRLAGMDSSSLRLQNEAFDVVDGRKATSSKNRSNLSTTSGFKSLKHHQDLPKNISSTVMINSSNAPSGTIANGLLGKIKGSLGGKGSKLEKPDPISERNAGAVSKKSQALTKSKVPIDYDLDKVDIRGSGILDRCGKSVLLTSSSEEQIYQNEGKNSPVPSQDYFGVDTSYSVASSSAPELRVISRVLWRCPHCTYDNESSAKICVMCSKSKDFMLED